ncbi:polysaccharide deacetylase family protein [Dysgonomonas sp. 520]|uniref:polysaccharide deacetylase family protein n=1 Tax=Dysgonomonas sp. 520 TaxID=2302931 RepID=UPI001C86BE8F|nr:polysaccharide deacetylase family protein [Dysgonomonas sp. 520]
MRTTEQMNILTFDIEEWYHFDIFSTEDKWLDYPPRIDLYLPQVLDKLDENETKATFFCLGWIARTYPEIIKKIQQRGHEIACHSDKHFFVREMTPESFNLDLAIALDSIENVIGQKVVSFRAPAFTISEDATWAFEVLAKNGIENDCSIFPTTRSFGGFPSFGEAKPTLIKYKEYRIKEFPINMGKVMGKDFVFGGGGYFRLFPYSQIKKLMNKSDYNMTYLHMRDFDYKQPRFKYLSNMRYFKSYYGIKNAYPKFEKMLKDFKWINVEEAVNQIDFNSIRQLDLK